MRKIIFTTSVLLYALTSFAQQGWWKARLQRADGHDIVFNFEWKQENGKPVW